METPAILFGATSIVGYHLARSFPATVRPFVPPGQRSPSVRGWPTLQLECPVWIETLFQKQPPSLLFYCHAVCDVAKCESDPAWAHEVNVHHVDRVMAALPSHTRLVYVSSDHVFGHDGVYTEASTPCPISVYGRTRVEAEQLVLTRNNALVVRTGLAIGSSPNGRSGHLDWLRYRTGRKLPVTIVQDESRSVVWADDLAARLMELAKSQETGIRHVCATRTVSRVALARHLMSVVLGRDPLFKVESRHQQATPHLGRIELDSLHDGRLSRPLASVIGGTQPCMSIG